MRDGKSTRIQIFFKEQRQFLGFKREVSSLSKKGYSFTTEQSFKKAIFKLLSF